MDIIDNAVSKAKEAFDFACEKTGEVVKTQKQKFDIASLKNKRNKDFEALGKLYYKIIKDTETDNEEISLLISAIKEKSEAIKEIKAEMEAEKNITIDEE
jgi:hypothetical protein